MEPATELANPQQLKFLITLHNQLGVPYDPAEISTLSKWEVAARISVLRGRPASSSDQLDQALLDVLKLRADALGEES
jgi:hypothetical protein